MSLLAVTTSLVMFDRIAYQGWFNYSILLLLLLRITNSILVFECIGCERLMISWHLAENTHYNTLTFTCFSKFNINPGLDETLAERQQ